MSRAREPIVALAATALLAASPAAAQQPEAWSPTVVADGAEPGLVLATMAAAPASPSAGTVPARAARQDDACEGGRDFGDWFWMAGLGSEVRSDISTNTGQERALLGGVIAPFGCDGRYMARTTLTTGFRSTPSSLFASLFGGMQASVARSFSQPFIELTPTTRVEPYLLVGGGGYFARDLREAPDESVWVPNLTTAFGLRLAAMESVIGLTLLEIAREQRFGRFDARWYFRFGLAW